MTNGYPTNYRAASYGARAVAVARPAATGLGMFELSATNIARALAALPKVPAPHPALLIGAAGLLALGYAYRYFDEQANNLMVFSRSRRNPALVYLGNRDLTALGTYEHGVGGGQRMLPYRQKWQTLPNSYFYQVQNWPGSLDYLPADYIGGVVDPVPAGDAVNGPFFMETTHIKSRKYGAISREYRRAADFYRNPTAAPIPLTIRESKVLPVAPLGRPALAGAKSFIPYKARAKHRSYADRAAISDAPPLVAVPPALYPILPWDIVPDIPSTPTRPVTRVDPVTGIQIIAAPIRGVATVPTVGALAVPMTAIPNEVKAAATRATMNVISSTLGQLGEAFDFTRCFIAATGNTYKRGDYEKPIPKWRWADALLDLGTNNVGLNRTEHGGAPRRRNTTFRDGNFIDPRGKIITPQKVAADFAKCLLREWFEDLVAAKQSEIIVFWQNKFGLSIGPFGIESLYSLAMGEIPYQGLFDLNLERKL